MKKHSNLQSNLKAVFSIVTLTFIAYTVFSSLILSIDLGSNSGFPYYNYLTDAISRGSFALQPQSTHDLSYFNGSWYMYWGIAPLIFTSVFHIFSISDVLYTLVAGSLSTGLIYLLLKEISRTFKLKTSKQLIIAFVVAFALASPNLYLSLAGRIWHTNQIIAVLYALGALLFYVRFIRTKHSWDIVTSIILFCMAVLSRMNFIFYGFLYIPLLFHYKNKPKIMKMILTKGVIIGGLFLSMFFFYNYTRFGNIFETGYQYQLGADRFDYYIKSGNILSIEYVWRNIYYYFLNFPEIVVEKGSLLHFDSEGNSVFAMYPYTILLVMLPRVIVFFKKKKYRTIFLGFVTTFVVLLLFLLHYFATGWVQLGNRYFFDLMPLIFAMLPFIMKNVSVKLLYVLVAIGVCVNIVGTYAFYTVGFP